MLHHPSYYYTPEEWSRLGMMGPLPDERNSLLQRNNMKLNEVEDPRPGLWKDAHNHLGFDNGKAYRVNSYCWQAEWNEDTEEIGNLCTRREKEGGDWSRSASGKEDGETEYVFVSNIRKEVFSSLEDAKLKVTLRSLE